MTWEEKLKEHPASEALDALELAAKSAREGVDASDESSVGVEHLLRIEHMVGYLRRRLSHADPLLVASTELDAVTTAATNAKAQVDAFVSSKDVNLLQQVNAALDKTMRQVASVPQLATADDGHGLRSVVQKFHEESKRLVAELVTRVGEANTKASTVETALKALGETIEANKVRLDQAIAQHQQQFSDTQNTRQQTFDAAEAERQKKATATETSWTTRLTDLETKSKEELAAALKAAKDEQAEFCKTRNESAKEALANLNSQLEEAKKIVGLIGGTGMAGGYQRDANSEGKAAWWWNLLTVLAFVGLIGFAIALFVATKSDAEFSWAHLLGRSLVIVAFGFFAAFGAQRAKSHRDSERRHRHKQLALESMNAFIDDLEPEVKKTIKVQIADAFFTKTDTVPTSGGDGVQFPLKECFELTKQAISKLK